MAEKINATCSICGKGYHKCLSCQDKMAATPWKMYTDTPEHYKIYQVINGLSIGVYTKEEAKAKLQNIDLSDLNELRDNIKKIIKDVMKEDKQIVVEKVEVEPDFTVKEDTVEEEVVSDIEVEVAEAPFISRKKKYSK